MPRRLLSPVLALAVVLALGAGCADDVSPGIRVGEAKISIDDVLDETAEWASNPRSQLYQEPDEDNPDAAETYPTEVVDAVLQQRILWQLHNAEFDELGLELDDAARDNAIQALFGGDAAAADAALGGFSDEYGQRYIDDNARQIAVQTALGDEGYNAWATEALRETDIEVNPRFGSWDPEAQTVVGPEGPIDPVAPSLEGDPDAVVPNGQ